MEYTKKEITYLLIVTVILAFVFGFNDNRETFEISYWLANFAKMLVIVGLSVFVHDFAHDIAAKKYGFISEYRLWGIKKFRLFGKDKFPRTYSLFGRKITVSSFPIGILIALLVTLLSNGRLFFTAISSYGLMVKRSYRLGKRFVEVTDFEEAKIALAGPMANVLVAILFGAFNGSGIFTDIILINSLMPVFDMLPLPGLDGFKVFAGSKAMYVFTFLLVLGIAILIRQFSALAALFAALGIAFLFLIIYAYSSSRL